MEMKTGSRSKKRKRRLECVNLPTQEPSAFSILLAATAASKSPFSSERRLLIKTCLNKYLKFLVALSESFPSTSYQDLMNSTLALLPLLLKSRCAEIVSICAKIVGTTSLLSYEMNKEIACDGFIVKALLLSLFRVTVAAAPEVKKKKKRVLATASLCNALLDLSITSFGRQRLLQFSAINYLMLGFLQVIKSSRSCISLHLFDKEGVVCIGTQCSDDEAIVLLLNAVVTLVNSCSIEKLLNIPRRLVEMLCSCWKKLWAKICMCIVSGEILTVWQGRCCYLSNLTPSCLAESIFRLSMSSPYLSLSLTSEIIVKRLCGTHKSSFADFILNYWESSPFLLKRPSKNIEDQDDIFNSFLECLHCVGRFPSSLSSILQGMISCFPIASDEVDISNFLKEIKHKLGCPIIYQQDIRVLRTDYSSKTEEHYFQEFPGNHCFGACNCLSTSDMQECEDAYNEGYTIALRGMEFRFNSIAAIVDKLASVFGQPSVGANLYLTPPNSQGLACHFDDHCVFVCQLLGSKHWIVSPEPIVQLPRLYEHHQLPLDSRAVKRQILLREGDVLYIPRGFPHEASTIAAADESIEPVGFSLHLTLSIEIEPPFEWEGFMHVALHHWSQNLIARQQSSTGSFDTYEAASLNLLHAAVWDIGTREPSFRKACFVAAIPFSDFGERLELSQRAMFSELIHKVYELSSFSDTVSHVRMVIQRDEDPFHRMRWLNHLSDNDMIEQLWDSPSKVFMKVLALVDLQKCSMGAAFVHIKSKFCEEVVFDDVKDSFRKLYVKYKKARDQYMKGMLSLHY